MFQGVLPVHAVLQVCVSVPSSGPAGIKTSLLAFGKEPFLSRYDVKPAAPAAASLGVTTIVPDIVAKAASAAASGLVSFARSFWGSSSTAPAPGMCELQHEILFAFHVNGCTWLVHFSLCGLWSIVSRTRCLLCWHHNFIVRQCIVAFFCIATYYSMRQAFMRQFPLSRVYVERCAAPAADDDAEALKAATAARVKLWSAYPRTVAQHSIVEDGVRTALQVS